MISGGATKFSGSIIIEKGYTNLGELDQPNLGELDQPNIITDIATNSLTDHLDNIKGLGDSVRRIGLLESFVITVRTDNISNFCTDFFFPGFFNLALKVRNVGLKTFLCITMPLCDIITFPFRLITVIPRCIFNAKFSKENHPLYKFLKARGHTTDQLREGHVLLKIESITSFDNGTTTKKNNIDTFNLVQLPKSISVEFHNSSYTSYTSKKNNENEK